MKLMKTGATAILLMLLSGTVFGSVDDDYRFETSSFMKATLYRRPDRLAADIAPEAQKAESIPRGTKLIPVNG